MIIDRRARARTEARAWWIRLGRPSVLTAEVRAFGDWLDRPENEAEWSRLEREAPPPRGRYVVLPGSGGSTVVDSFTGEPAWFAAQAQIDIPPDDAREIAGILNRRHAAPDRH